MPPESSFLREAGIQAVSALCVLCLCLFANAADSEIARPTIDADGVQRVRIVGGSYFFKPSHIVVKARVPVQLTLVKEQGLTPHDFVLRAAEAGRAIEQPLGTDPIQLTFTASTPGKFTFYCSNKLLFMPSHRERGMHGTLEVID